MIYLNNADFNTIKKAIKTLPYGDEFNNLSDEKQQIILAADDLIKQLEKNNRGIHAKYPFKWKSEKNPERLLDIFRLFTPLEQKEYNFFMYENISNERIDVLDLGTRLENGLKRNGVMNIYDLARSSNSINSLHGIGDNSKTEILTKLFEFYRDWLKRNHPDDLKKMYEVA